VEAAVKAEVTKAMVAAMEEVTKAAKVMAEIVAVIMAEALVIEAAAVTMVVLAL